MKKLLIFIGILSIGGLVVAAPLAQQAKAMLTKEVHLDKADWIVVLGGESSQRVLGAAELYHQGAAPNIFVTGQGDCKVIARRLERAGVPKHHIRYECLAKSTYENSVNVKQHLRPYNIKKAILITSWYHSYRALKVFQKTWPEVTWGMEIVYPSISLSDTRTMYEIGYVFSEYVKIIYYVGKGYI